MAGLALTALTQGERRRKEVLDMEAMEILQNLGIIMAGLGVFFAGLGILIWGSKSGRD